MQEEFPRQLSALDAVFAALDDFARRHGVPPDTVRDLGVIIEELFTNQVRHAGPGTGTIGLRLSLRDGDVEVELRDADVAPFDPTASPEVDVTGRPEERQPGGLGIHLVRRLSDRFEWDYDRTRRESRIRVVRRLKGR